MGKRGPAPKYPYAQWLDGNIWGLMKGIDYLCDEKLLTRCIRRHAANLGLSVTIHTTDYGVMVHAYFLREDGLMLPVAPTVI